MADELGFAHRYVPGTDPDAPPLLLLHGTGGTEDDLLPLGKTLAPGAALLSPRGKVLERGMPRFFRRLAEGVFDEDDLRRRADELAQFLAAAREAYGMRSAPVAVGFSNGANMAAALLLLHPGALGGAVLFRAMVPLTPDPLPDLSGTPAALFAGRFDPMAPPPQTEALAGLLRGAGASVTVQWTDAGHALTAGDVEAAREWMVTGGPAGGRASGPLRSET